MALVEFLMETLDGLKGTDIVHFDVRGKYDYLHGYIEPPSFCNGR